MLKSFKTKNFQSHLETFLEFVPGVNVLVGKSQSGKTAVLRALSLLTTNRPLGGRFFSDFAGKKGTTGLDLTLMGGDKISLEKNISLSKEGKKEVRSSAYSLNNDSDPYKAFGDKVPDQIETKLNLSDLNVQKQFDEPFLICSSPGEVARVFNKVTRLEKTDQWNSELAKQINLNGSEVKLLKKQQKQTKKDLKEYENVLEIEREVQRAERLHVKLESITAEMADVEELVDETISKQEDLRVLREWLEVEGLYQEAEKIFETKKATEADFKSLSALVNNLSEIREDKEYYQAAVTAEDWVDEGLQLVQELKDREKEVQQIGRILRELDQLSLQIKTTNHEKEEDVSEYISILVRLGKCPTCFSVIDEKRMEEIIKRI